MDDTIVRDLASKLESAEETFGFGHLKNTSIANEVQATLSKEDTDKLEALILAQEDRIVGLEDFIKDLSKKINKLKGNGGEEDKYQAVLARISDVNTAVAMFVNDPHKIKEDLFGVAQQHGITVTNRKEKKRAELLKKVKSLNMANPDLSGLKAEDLNQISVITGHSINTTEDLKNLISSAGDDDKKTIKKAIISAVKKPDKSNEEEEEDEEVIEEEEKKPDKSNEEEEDDDEYD